MMCHCCRRIARILIKSLMIVGYISDQDSDSNTSDVLAVQDSGKAVPSTLFTPIGNRAPAKQLQRAQSAMSRRYYRCSETLYKKVAEMTTQTGWTGFLVLRSPDGGQYLYGWKGGWLTDPWLISPTDVVPTKANSSHGSMTKVMDKVVKTGKGKKLNQLVLDTPQWKMQQRQHLGCPPWNPRGIPWGQYSFQLMLLPPSLKFRTSPSYVQPRFLDPTLKGNFRPSMKQKDGMAPPWKS